MPEELREGRPEKEHEPKLEHPSVRSEQSDASLGGVTSVIVAALVLGAVVFTSVFWFFRAQQGFLSEVRRSQFPLSPSPDDRVPVEPRLEQLDRLAKDQASNVYVREDEKLKVLNSYGSTAAKGYIHIPIERAMDVAADSLPARSTIAEKVHVTAAGAAALLIAPAQPLLAATALFSAREELDHFAGDWRQNGLLDRGESNSGRVFKGRKAPWLGQ